jgi:hypothetical protein
MKDDSGHGTLPITIRAGIATTAVGSLYNKVYSLYAGSSNLYNLKLQFQKIQACRVATSPAASTASVRKRSKASRLIERCWPFCMPP